jgi:methionyl-tRNA formyltransferase
MKIAVENGFIQIVSLQFQQKKKMNASELLNGIAFSEEAKLTSIKRVVCRF